MSASSSKVSLRTGAALLCRTRDCARAETMAVWGMGFFEIHDGTQLPREEGRSQEWFSQMAKQVETQARAAYPKPWLPISLRHKWT